MAEQGITQFLDIGSGLPTEPNVHEVVRQVHPGARIVYVDNDAIVIAEGQALRDEPGVITVEGDLRRPADILTNPNVTGLLDLSQPLGVLTVAIWHFMPDTALEQAQTELRKGLPPGSYLALSHGCLDTTPAATIRAAEALYKQTTNPLTARTRAQIAALMDGYTLVEPGLVGLHEWRPRHGDPYPEQSGEALACVGILRST